MTDSDERFFAWLVWLYPRAFRDRYREDLLAFFRQDRQHPKYGSGVLRPIRFWMATVRDLVRAVTSQRRIARRENAAFGPPRSPWFRRSGQDMRFAWRGMRASPGVTISALTVLTLGIGAGTAVFSVVDAVALRGLPFPDDRRLVRVEQVDHNSGRPVQATPQDYADWSKRQDVFAHIGAATSGEFAFRDEPGTKLRVVRVTASLFEVLQVTPSHGRVFNSQDERTGAAPVAVISDRLWQRRFNSDPQIIGRTVSSTSGDVAVIGVMPPGFSYPLASVTAGPVDVWLPFVPTEAQLARGRSRNFMLGVIARLEPDTTVDAARSRMSQIGDALVREYPDWLPDYGVGVRPLIDVIVSPAVRSWMLLLLGAVAVVVLMACLNAANLLVARAVVRGPELAVRAALGASRWDLARSLLVESLMMAAAGTAGGVLLAVWGVEILRTALPVNVPRLASVALDMRVLTISVLAAVLTAVVFGTIPALQASRPNVVEMLGQGGRSHSGGRTNRRVRAVLVVAEVGLSVVLLSGAALFLASFLRVTSVDLGFNPRHVITFLPGNFNTRDLVPADTRDRQEASVSGQALVADAVERVRAVPGVVDVSVIQGGSPLSRNSMSVPVRRADRRDVEFKGPDEPFVRPVGPAYLNVLRGMLVSGRWIAETDVTGTTPVAVLSEDAARRYFGSENPLGKGLLISGYERTVVGVVRSMRWRGPEAEIVPEAFVAFRQTSASSAQLIIRTEQDPAVIMPALGAAIRQAMPTADVTAPEFLERSYAMLLAQRRFNMIILLLFGAVAVAIAAVGIYGLMSFLIAQRRREIGVRVALGATPSGILAMMLSRAMRMVMAGMVPGILAALLLERTARAFLFEAKPHDPVIYAGVVAIFLAAGLLAASGPARRATRVDPLVALRQD